MRIADIIEMKRSGDERSREEIQFVVDGLVCGDITDYQTSALWMVTIRNDMNKIEAADLTMGTVHSAV